MKTTITLLLIGCFNAAFAQWTTSPHKMYLKSDSTKYYIDNKLITKNDTVASETSSAIYLKYVTPVNSTDSLNFLIDSTIVHSDYLTYLDPNEINSINVIKNSQYPKGLVAVKLKNHLLLSKILSSKLLSFRDMTNRYISRDQKNKPVIFLVDKGLITDTTAKRIPEICLKHVSVAKAKDMPYFKTAMPNVLIMMISTKPISTKPYHEDIIIRGDRQVVPAIN